MGINIKFVQVYLIGLSLPLASKESFLKNKLDREIDTSYEKFQKCSKNRYYFQQQFETHFWPGKSWNLVFSISEKVVDNWISFKKKTNFESIGILSRKVELKYEAGAASSSTSFQNSNGDQHQIRSSSFKQVISSLSFRRKLIT